MSFEPNDKESNPLEDQMKELKEDQDNLYNPGSKIGTGKPSLFYKNLFKSNNLMIIIGLLFLIPLIINLVSDFSLIAIFNSLITTLIGIILIIGGILRKKQK